MRRREGDTLMPRYLKVRGKPGCIVPNPHGDARRFVGKERKPVEPDAKPDPSLSLVDMFTDREEVIEDEFSLRRAIASGHLDLLAKGVGKDADSVAWEPVVAPAPAEKPVTKSAKGG